MKTIFISIIAALLFACQTKTVVPTTNSSPTSAPTPETVKPEPVKPSEPTPPSAKDVRLEEAIAYLEKGNFKKDIVVLIDFSKNSSVKRFRIVDLKTRKEVAYQVAHGVGSDANHDGLAEKFSNIPNSKMSSLGFYKTAETYTGQHGYSLRLDGLSSTNSNARSRFIVIHAADYVRDNGQKTGRSWGCPALSPAVAKSVIDRIKGGVLIYAYAK